LAIFEVIAIVWLASPALASGDGSRGVVALARAENDRGMDTTGVRPLLAREMFRQAVLMAAREQLHLATRDATLGESIEVEAAGKPIHVAVYMPNAQYVKLSIRRGGADDKGPPLLEHELRVASTGQHVELTDLAEKCATLTDLFRDALVKAGYKPGPEPPARPDAAVPRAIAERLGRMDFASQFAAARGLHEELRSGRSFALEGALVRAYANLGVLTEHHWSPAHKVFKARALLYAQRMVARDASSPWGHWHRAYARALAGLQRTASIDLDTAEEASRGRPRDVAASDIRWDKPAWVPVIEAACYFDHDALKAAAKDEGLAELALLLRFLSLNEPSAPILARDAARDLLMSRPECDRAVDALSGLGGVANQHQSTLLGLAVVDRVLPRALVGLPGLPASVEEALEAGEDRSKVVEALAGDGAGDAGELAWSVLAGLERESEFAAIVRRMVFMRDAWAVPIDEFLAEALPRVEGHPLHSFLVLYGTSGEDRLRAFAELRPVVEGRIGELDLTQCRPLVQEIRKVDPEFGRQVSILADIAGDGVCLDLSMRIRTFNDEAKVKFARELNGVSRYAPVGPATQVTYAWDEVKRRADSLEKMFARSPTFLTALGARLAAEGRLDDAHRVLKASVAISPEVRGMRALADVYKAQGDRARWKETIDAILEGEDTGLEHAQLRVALAQDLMARGEWEEARPYAEAAAESYAEWAMLCAAQCYEGLGDWDRAEDWIVRIAERYGRAPGWYLWCRRTGHGDVEAALRAAQEQFRGEIERGGVRAFPFGPVEILGGDRRRALNFLVQIYGVERKPLVGLLGATLADELGEKDQRDRLLAAVAGQADDPEPAPGMNAAMARLAAWMRESLSGDAIDLAKLDRLLAEAPGSIHADLPYYAGRFLELRGRKDESVRYLDACATSPQALAELRTLASVALRARGLEPGRAAEKADQEAPAGREK
jgi:tetratricopeptide (TPR) repeat protein